jgi:hypothetical protein
MLRPCSGKELWNVWVILSVVRLLCISNYSHAGEECSELRLAPGSNCHMCSYVHDNIWQFSPYELAPKFLRSILITHLRSGPPTEVNPTVFTLTAPLSEGNRLRLLYT